MAIAAMIEEKMTVRITEAELARGIHAVLSRVQEGDEVIVEQDDQPVAIIQPPSRGRLLSESIAIARQREKERGHAAVLDPDFADDVQEAIDSRREPFSPPAWD
jgi:antitoxin (DNA-binding transcriptional repressor) of toxin-antitoxin stability system